jgi:hypothetical protein
VLRLLTGGLAVFGGDFCGDSAAFLDVVAVLACPGAGGDGVGGAGLADTAGGAAAGGAAGLAGVGDVVREDAAEFFVVCGAEVDFVVGRRLLRSGIHAVADRRVAAATWGNLFPRWRCPLESELPQQADVTPAATVRHRRTLMRPIMSSGSASGECSAYQVKAAEDDVELCRAVQVLQDGVVECLLHRLRHGI